MWNKFARHLIFNYLKQYLRAEIEDSQPTIFYKNYQYCE